jgi:hypothetical protein
MIQRRHVKNTPAAAEREPIISKERIKTFNGNTLVAS